MTVICADCRAERAEKLENEEALQRRMESEMAALFAYLDDTREKWGEKAVYRWIDEWFIREINND